MKSHSTTPLRLFGALTLAVSLVTTVVPADAQQSSIHGTGSMMWTGGNRISQTTHPLSQTSFAAMETNNGNARYQVVPIGVLPGKTTSFLTIVRAVNNLEHVTGYSYVYTGDIFLTSQGFIWQKGKLKALPLLNGWPGAFAFGINDRDQVVGTANNMDSSGNYLQTATLWDHGQPVNLGTLQPDWNSAAFDVNIWGVAVGISAPINADFNTPIVWYGGTMHVLPLLPGFKGALAEEINALGVIAGRQASDTNLIPCIWYWNGTGYTPVNLGSLGGDNGQAFGINNLTQTVGYSYYPGDIHTPGFLWDLKHGLQALPLLAQDTDAQAYNINDLGQIVGDSFLTDSSGNFISQRSAIWENGTVTDLQTLVPPGTPPLTYETGNINNVGEITVNATNPDGSSTALLLVPIHH
jgi:uncharacterized membrane protein